MLPFLAFEPLPESVGRQTQRPLIVKGNSFVIAPSDDFFSHPGSDPPSCKEMVHALWQLSSIL